MCGLHRPLNFDLYAEELEAGKRQMIDFSEKLISEQQRQAICYSPFPSRKENS